MEKNKPTMEKREKSSCSLNVRPCSSAHRYEYDAWNSQSLQKVSSWHAHSNGSTSRSQFSQKEQEVPGFERSESLQDIEEKKHVFDRWDASSKLFRIRSTPFKPVLEPIEEVDE
jgi:hypothetical protein